jgi:hypothetical protein
MIRGGRARAAGDRDARARRARHLARGVSELDSAAFRPDARRWAQAVRCASRFPASGPGRPRGGALCRRIRNRARAARPGRSASDVMGFSRRRKSVYPLTRMPFVVSCAAAGSGSTSRTSSTRRRSGARGHHRLQGMQRRHQGRRHPPARRDRSVRRRGQGGWGRQPWTCRGVRHVPHRRGPDRCGGTRRPTVLPPGRSCPRRWSRAGRGEHHLGDQGGRRARCRADRRGAGTGEHRSRRASRTRGPAQTGRRASTSRGAAARAGLVPAVAPGAKPATAPRPAMGSSPQVAPGAKPATAPRPAMGSSPQVAPGVKLATAPRPAMGSSPQVAPGAKPATAPGPRWARPAGGAWGEAATAPGPALGSSPQVAPGAKPATAPGPALGSSARPHRPPRRRPPVRAGTSRG